MAEKKWLSQQLGEHVLQPETLMMSYGYDPALSERSVKPPVFHTSTFVMKSAQEGKEMFELAYGMRQKKTDENVSLIYSRINNPNFEMLENRLSVWDKSESSLVFSSGMSAISTTLFTLLRPGDVLIHSDPIYGGSDFLIKKVLPQFGIKIVGFDASRGEAAMKKASEQAHKLGDVVGIYIETPANPTNDLVDIAAARRVANEFSSRKGKGIVIVDNTMLGPLCQTPLDHGADLVLTSLSKYIGGHSDLIAGSCSGSHALINSICATRTILGTMSDPQTCWLLMRSLETFKLRMEAALRNAQIVAEFLNHHAKVKSVRYLGFLKKDDPNYEIYHRQCTGAGATFSFEVDGGEKEAFAVLDNLKLIKLAVSLGGTESLACHPGATTHADVSIEDKKRLGITSGLIRLSVGVEKAEDLIADLKQAFSHL